VEIREVLEEGDTTAERDGNACKGEMEEVGVRERRAWWIGGCKRSSEGKMVTGAGCRGRDKVGTRKLKARKRIFREGTSKG